VSLLVIEEGLLSVASILELMIRSNINPIIKYG